MSATQTLATDAAMAAEEYRGRLNALKRDHVDLSQSAIEDKLQRLRGLLNLIISWTRFYLSPASTPSDVQDLLSEVEQTIAYQETLLGR